jgi:hypothetical protein
VFQCLLPERPTPEKCVETYYLQRTRFESIAERKLRRRQLTEDGNVESGRDLRQWIKSNGLGMSLLCATKRLITAWRSKKELQHDVCDEYGEGQDAYPIFLCPWRRSVANRR